MTAESLKSVSEELARKYPCRETQISSLCCALGHPSFPNPPAIYVTGFPASGKTSVTRAFFEALSLQYVWIDCGETFTAPLLFDRIVNSLRRISTEEYSRVKMSGDINHFAVETQNAMERIQGKVTIVLV
jgi:Cdc6-like AAA superfamily ATPase